ncbi:MAG: sulfatase activating formylglycine-generating enzyme [Paraglaciecola sp.]|jgi:formylglycine-generating enzyme required for sulfatase activity
MTQQVIDERIKQAQRKGLSVYLLTGSLTLLLLLGFFVWLFLVKGHSLIVAPQDAANGAKVKHISGVAWVGDRHIYTLGGELTIEIAADTFETAVVVLNSQSPSTIEVALLPSPAVINASASSTAENYALLADRSQWFLDGQLIHVGANLNHSVASGNYQLRISNPFFNDVTQDLRLARAQQLSLSPVLAPIQGSINIQSYPQGAQVIINGRSAGLTPVVVELAGGEHEVVVSQTNYQTVTDKVNIGLKDPQPTRNYQLAAKLGVLRVAAQPSNGLLLINNIEQPLGDVELAINRKHKVEYRKAGFSQFSQSINVTANETPPLDIILDPEFGTLVINSNVSAEIEINGKRLGTTPYKARLSAVTQNIQLSLAGYRSVARSIVLLANQTKSLSVTLLTEFDARREEGKALFVDTLGIKMRKFKADALVLGSADNETGRRRNEHRVEVDFNRQFWVSAHEITESQFAAALNGKGGGSSKLPVTGISWLQAAQYCNWLSQQEGLPQFYLFSAGRYLGVDASSRGYRLPTEAEWEWLAKKSNRASSTRYVWGNQDAIPLNAGNFADSSRKAEQVIVLQNYTDKQKGIAEVGSFKADRIGLFDMAGNVSEWVHDYYTNAFPDMTKRHIDYLGATTGHSWVYKGGNYQSGRVRELRVAFREFASGGKPEVGFRIARYDN